jgi:hypothetical protein
MIENCRHCGKEVEGGTVFCPECQAIAGTKKPKRIWLFSLVFSGVLLSLAGIMLWHGGLSLGDLSLDAIWGKPAAVINGEKISRSDLKARSKIFQRILERQYGNDLFTGDRGRTLFVTLGNKVLNDMLEEKLVRQEARKLKTQITDEQVKQKLDLITKEVFGTWENFQARLKEDGMTKEDLQKNIRYLLLLEAVKEAKSPEGGTPDISFGAWLIQARQKAEVTVYDSENLPGSAPSLAGGCCSLTGSSGGGCGGQSATPRPIDPKIESEAQKAALEAFQKSNPADKNLAAKATDYGCHIQVDIQKEGRVVKSYSYQDGKVFDNS